MSDFKDYFTDPNYIGGYNAILSGNHADRNKGMVYVEDDSDVWFWRRFIEQIFPNHYNFRTATHPTQTDKPQQGKTALRQFYHGLNPKILIARDADFDWLLPNGLDDLDNPYILHTFAYSKESVLIEKYAVSQFFSNTLHTIAHQVDIEQVIERFSALAYRALCGLVQHYLLSQDSSQSTLAFDTLAQCFNALSHPMVLDNLTFNEKRLDEIDENLTKVLPSDSDTEAESYLSKHGITRANAYRFISGHQLDDFVTTTHKALCNQLLNVELGIVKQTLTGKAVGERQKQLSAIFKTNFQLDTFYRQYPINSDDEIHQKILQKITHVQSNHAR